MVNKKQYQKEYYLKNKDKIKDTSKKTYKRNIVKIKAKNKNWYLDNDNYKTVIWMRAKQRSVKNKYPFNIEISDIVIPEFCPILGIKLERNFGTTSAPNSPSIDKINPILGYTKGNIRIISHKANTMKNNATQEELLKFCTNILNLMGAEYVKSKMKNEK